MWHDGVMYPDDNSGHVFACYLSYGDVDRLFQIAQKEGIQTNGLNDNSVSNLISHVIRKYYKEHEVAKFMTMTTGTPYKDYEDYQKLMQNR